MPALQYIHPFPSIALLSWLPLAWLQLRLATSHIQQHRPAWSHNGTAEASPEARPGSRRWLREEEGQGDGGDAQINHGSSAAASAQVELVANTCKAVMRFFFPHLLLFHGCKSAFLCLAMHSNGGRGPINTKCTL